MGGDERKTEGNEEVPERALGGEGKEPQGARRDGEGEEGLGSLPPMRSEHLASQP